MNIIGGFAQIYVVYLKNPRFHSMDQLERNTMSWINQPSKKNPVSYLKKMETTLIRKALASFADLFNDPRMSKTF